MMPVYNKLVRDNILNIIQKDGLRYESRLLKPEEHLVEIKKKLYEEVKEFDETTNTHDALEEMADILELLHAALRVQNHTFEDLEQIRIAKKINVAVLKKVYTLLKWKIDEVNYTKFNRRIEYTQ